MVKNTGSCRTRSSQTCEICCWSFMSVHRAAMAVVTPGEIRAGRVKKRDREENGTHLYSIRPFLQLRQPLLLQAPPTREGILLRRAETTTTVLGLRLVRPSMRGRSTHHCYDHIIFTYYRYFCVPESLYN